jgi:Holliday junction resolvase RusA-like endonuclease
MKFKVNIKPIGKARARVTRYGTFTPQKTKDFEQAIAWSFREQFKAHEIILKPIKLTICATFEPPKSYSNPKRLRCLKTHHSKKPDIDNIAKAIMDSLNGLAYKDDNQVCELNIIKRYGEKDNITIEIEQLTNV